MKKQPSKRLEFWFHFGIGILTIGIMFGMAAFISSQVGQSMFPWWVYPAFAVYVIGVLSLDHILFSQKDDVSNEKSNTINKKLLSEDSAPAFCRIDQTDYRGNNEARTSGRSGI